MPREESWSGVVAEGMHQRCVNQNWPHESECERICVIIVMSRQEPGLECRYSDRLR